MASALGLTYAVVRECAIAVHERLYPDENGNMVAKWKLNKTTAKLAFSQRWVLGLLERYQKSIASGGSAMTVGEGEGEGEGDDADSTSSSSDEDENEG